MQQRCDAVLFDLLSALVDSWSLWDELAGDPALGRRWRQSFLEAAAAAARYEPYLGLVGASAAAVGLPASLADTLEERWDDLEFWPEAPPIVAKLAETARVGIVTNCAEDLGHRAADKLGVEFAIVMTAERAGFYKPDRRIYARAIDELEAAPGRTLYVAGSPYDVCGAAAVGMPVYWHNRIDLADARASALSTHSSDRLTDLLMLKDH